MTKKLCFKLTVLSFAVAASFCTLSSVDSFLKLSEAQAQPATTDAVVMLPDFSKLVEDNGKAVVSIESVRKARNVSKKGATPNQIDPFDEFRRFGFPFPFDPQRAPHPMPERRGQGSGFIISPDGLILTNHHVVEGADELTVQLFDKKDYKAKVIGSDQKTDIALIKIDAKDLPTVKIGSSDKVKVGEWVAAIGAPFGLNNTVTAGIVSAKSRNLPDEQFVPFIQTDVAVNPGNSGGPLFNMKGEVIGINSQIFSTSGGFMGLSFAIPIDLAVQIKDQLLKDGKVSRGRIGVVMQPLTPELAKSFGLKDNKGALVVQLEANGPAEKAGVKDGDIIIEFNGTKIDEASDLSRAVASTKPNSKAKMKVLREGKEVSLDLVVAEMSSDNKLGPLTGQEPVAEDRLGVVARPVTDLEKKKKLPEGLFVQNVSGAAAEAGIRVGDVIVSVGGTKVKTMEELRKVVKNAKDSIAVLVDRKGQRVFIPVKLKEAEK